MTQTARRRIATGSCRRIKTVRRKVPSDYPGAAFPHRFAELASSKHIKSDLVAIVLLFCLFSGLQARAQTKRALLVGINTYQPAGTQAEHPAGCTYGRCELGTFENLDGAVNDAQAMADLLTSPKFGFPAENVVLLTNPKPPRPRPGVVILPDGETTRDGILAAIQKYLVDEPQQGDTVVFYDASHGSLRVNSKGSKLTVLINGAYVHADSTLVPSDAYKGGYDIRDREMTRIFNAALDKGIHLAVILDSCHSGGISRGIGANYRQRSLAFDPRDIAEGPDLLPNGQPRPAITERANNPAIVFSAAQQDQSAKEMPPSEGTSEPHGAFTAALLEALQALPGGAPAALVYQRVRAVLEGEDVPDQEPELDATAIRRQQPLFGGTPGDTGGIRAAALSTDEDGNVRLDIGSIAGIGIGSEFKSAVPGPSGQEVRLQVTGLDGITRSTAMVISSPKVKAAPGEIFELSRWVPAESAPLRIWHWPSNLSQDEILAAAAEIRSAGVVFVSDPAEEPWTHMLSWDGSNWTLQQARKGAPVQLGPKLAASVLKEHLSAGSKLWVNFPPSRDLAAKLTLSDPGRAVQAAGDLAGAQYALTGTLTADGPAYTWFHKSELSADPRVRSTPGHSPGCSSTSQYPVRSDWVAVGGAAGVETGGAALNKFVSLLAKVHGWLELADSGANESAGGYYSLALVPASGGAPLPAGQAVHQGDLLKLSLQSDERVVEKRWVYILDIDCHGKGTVLYPGNYTENQFPNAADTGRQFLLPGAPTLRIGPPYGVDTLILLSAVQPLPDPYLLNFEGAASRGGARLPLEKLLGQTSSGSRGFSGEVPTNWGIQTISIRSMPREATQ